MPGKKIGVIGDGNVGSALARGLKRAGHDVRPVGNDKAKIRETAGWAETVILAVPFKALDDVVQTAGEALSGKTVIDVTNALNPDMSLAIGFNTSGAEELQKKLPKARVVKSFNTVFAKNMETGKVGGEPISAFVAGDDQGAKATVLQLAREIGFDAIDCGPLQNARHLEPLGVLNIHLGYVGKMGTDIGFKLVHAR
ncbi:MAG: NADPH-dependent F420 reductase [Myxococcales bacterium]